MLPVHERFAAITLTALKKQRISMVPHRQRFRAQHGPQHQFTTTHGPRRHQHVPADAVYLVASSWAALVVIAEESVVVLHHAPETAHRVVGVHGAAVRLPGGARSLA